MTHRPDRRRALALLGATLAAPALARGAAPLTVVAGEAFATTWRIALPFGTRTGSLQTDVEVLLARIDREMSPWRRDGDVARFNRAPVGVHPLPEATLEVTRVALNLAAASDGAFDPTIGPRLGALGLGPIEGIPTGWRALRCKGAAVRKMRAGATIDLCGIAKGHAVDRIAELLHDLGHADALIEIGGDLRALGRHPEARAWRVGVEDPRPGARGIVGTVALPGAAVATSGTRWNGGHVIDTRRSAPVAAGPASVSVRAPDAMTADGWATALMAAGIRGPALARASGLDALFLWDRPGGLRRVATGDAAWS